METEASSLVETEVAAGEGVVEPARVLGEVLALLPATRAVEDDRIFPGKSPWT
jgi:hypothetical protein